MDAIRRAQGAIAAVAIVGAALAAGSSSSIPGPAKDGVVRVPYTALTWHLRTTDVGPAAPNAPVVARLYLAPRGGLPRLWAAAQAVSRPGSMTYRHFIGPARYRALYAPSATSVAEVERAARTAGFRVSAVAAANRYVEISGTAADAGELFGTRIERYRVGRRVAEAPSSPLSVPRSIGLLVGAVTGLERGGYDEHATTESELVPPKGTRQPHVQCSRSFGASTVPKYRGSRPVIAPCGYTGRQLRSVYEGRDAGAAAGVAIGVVSAYVSPWLLADADQVSRAHGDGAFPSARLRVTPANAYRTAANCTPSAWFNEGTLDVEAVHAMAPDATIDYYGAASCLPQDFADALDKLVDDNRVQVVSNSWDGYEDGETDQDVFACEQAFLQGTLQGITFVASSGDDGDAAALEGSTQVAYPASDPWVTAVGGTTDAIDASGRLVARTGWGTRHAALAAKGWNATTFNYGAGGGSSALFERPFWQTDVPGSSRMVPDVSMDADITTGMIEGETQRIDGRVTYAEFREGGTSLSSPLFAGLTAVALGRAGHRVGLIGPLVYGAARSAFADVARPLPWASAVRTDYANGFDSSAGYRYTLESFNEDTSLRIAKGWDAVTGVGAPTPAWLDALR